MEEALRILRNQRLYRFLSGRCLSCGEKREQIMTMNYCYACTRFFAYFVDLVVRSFEGRVSPEEKQWMLTEDEQQEEV